jgi:hypothetical protein
MNDREHDESFSGSARSSQISYGLAGSSIHMCFKGRESTGVSVTDFLLQIIN